MAGVSLVVLSMPDDISRPVAFVCLSFQSIVQSVRPSVCLSVRVHCVLFSDNSLGLYVCFFCNNEMFLSVVYYYSGSLYLSLKPKSKTLV